MTHPFFDSFSPMAYNPGVSGFDSLTTILGSLGLTSNLKLCLDSGDVASYSGTGQSWLDTSGNGYDFFRGATSSATTDDPTFNGTAGNLTANEFWGFDGGDFFQYDTVNESWMENIHKDNAQATIIYWGYWPAPVGVSSAVCGTRGVSTAHTGFIFQRNAGTTLIYVVNNAGASVLNIGMAATMIDDAWQFTAVSIDEAVGANGAILQLNSTQELFTSTYASPSAGAASFPLRIGDRGNSDSILLNGSKTGMFAAWDRALTAAELQQVYEATRSRFGV